MSDEADWVIEYKEIHRTGAKWKLHSTIDGSRSPVAVGKWLEDLGMELVSVSEDGRYIESKDGMDYFRARRML